MMRTIADSLGIDAREVPVPEALLSAAGAVGDWVSKLTGRRLPVSRKLARQLLAPGWTCSIEKAKRLLGYAPSRTVRQALEQSAQSYFEAGWL
jgi:nucleoside-diphosphate-sugar epimerase